MAKLMRSRYKTRFIQDTKSRIFDKVYADYQKSVAPMMNNILKYQRYNTLMNPFHNWLQHEWSAYYSRWETYFVFETEQARLEFMLTYG